jgi:hypothetical protein
MLMLGCRPAVAAAQVVAAVAVAVAAAAFVVVIRIVVLIRILCRMIRPAILADVEAIIAIGEVEACAYPRLKPDFKKMRKLVTMAISSAKHFCWVSEDQSGNVTGTLVGVSSENLWAQRQNCIVALWKSEIVGDGRRLMKEFLKWVDTRRIIRMAGIVPDSNQTDPRAWKLMERLGFRRYGGAYLIYN